MRNVPDFKITLWQRLLLWARHFAMLAMWGADEGGRDPVETKKIDESRRMLDEDWWMFTMSLCRNSQLTHEDVGALIRAALPNYVREHDKLLQRERDNTPLIEGVNWSRS